MCVTLSLKSTFLTTWEWTSMVVLIFPWFTQVPSPYFFKSQITTDTLGPSCLLDENGTELLFRGNACQILTIFLNLDINQKVSFAIFVVGLCQFLSFIKLEISSLVLFHFCSFYQTSIFPGSYIFPLFLAVTDTVLSLALSIILP